MLNISRIAKILDSVRELAIQYYKETGKPLGVTGEMAEFEAARILGLTLCSARQEGYDAIRPVGIPKRIQIKGRRILETSKPGQRLGKIRIEKDWDSVMLVLLNESYRAVEIYEALKPAIVAALSKPGSRARNERGALAVSKFKSIGNCIWPLKNKPVNRKASRNTGIRNAGLNFLEQALASSHRLRTSLGLAPEQVARIPFKSHIMVSKLHSPQNCWWHDISASKVSNHKWDRFILLCRKQSGNGFWILCIPKEWLIKNSNKLDHSDGKYRFHLSAGENTFVEKRGNGNLSFSQHLQSED